MKSWLFSVFLSFLWISSQVYGQQFQKMKDIFPEKNLPFELNGAVKPSVRPLHPSLKAQFSGVGENDVVYPIGKLAINPGIFAYTWIQESGGKYYTWISVFNEQAVKVLNTYNLTKQANTNRFKFKANQMQNSQIGLIIETANGSWKYGYNKASNTWSLTK
ncbi:MAG: hypothetical protein KatS3mg035_1819 [Bacteroidia bacterium]|nr:MAG: hypothetical protein KatS3mg035_1819 [Bacteroidia bacterium]